MKKSRLIISILMAAVMICISVVPAFAEGNTDLLAKENGLYNYAEITYNHYIYYDYTVPIAVPTWSEETKERIKTATEKVQNSTYTTVEDIEARYALIDEAKASACVDSSNLEWMIDYLAKDYNSTSYYDAETYQEIKTVYEEAQAALQSENEESIHCSYVKMRNLLDKLCLYNPIIGDVDQNGKLNILDVAIMQLDLAKLNKEEFTSSQNFVAGFNSNTKILTVADWLLALARLNDYESWYNENQSRINKLSEYEGLPENAREFNRLTEEVNEMYYFDCHRAIWINQQF